MSILSFQVETVGQSGQLPKVIYIETDNTVAEVIVAGYLNGLEKQGVPLNESDIALVSTRATPNAKSVATAFYNVSYSSGNWSLSATSSSLTLTDAHILVGNSSNVATDVAMSGDATLANTGALTIANGAVSAAKLASDSVTTVKILDANVTAGKLASDAVTTVKILAANVTLAKLAAGITPSHVIKFAAQYTTTGGNAAEAITVTGAAAATDRAFVQVVSQGTNTVTVLKAVVTNNTLTVTFSADPGNDAIINYQLIRVAS